MGASQSATPRSVSMENPSPAGILDISDDVVKRLKKGISKQVRENETESTARKAAAALAEPAAVPVKSATPPAPAARSPTKVYQNPTPSYLPGVTVTAGDVRRQMETELQKNDALWRERMTKLEETLNKTNAIMEKEYSTAVDNVRGRFAKAAPSHQLPPCQDLKAQILACYRAHPGETLLCSEEVAMFRNCVSLNRLKKLDADDEKTANVAKVAKAG